MKIKIFAKASARPVFCIATLKLERDPSKRMTSSRIDLCTSAGLKHPPKTIPTTANKTEATRGKSVSEGRINIAIAIPIAMGFLVTVGRSLSN